MVAASFVLTEFRTFLQALDSLEMLGQGYGYLMVRAFHLQYNVDVLRCTVGGLWGVL